MAQKATEQLVVHPNPTWLIVGALFFGGVGTVIVSRHQLSGWLGVAIGMVFFIVLLWTVFSPHSRLRLSVEGFSFGSMRRVSAYHWSDVAAFFPCRFAGRTWVCFRFSPYFTGERKVRRINQDSEGFDRFLPNDYGMRPVELAQLLEGWRLRHGNHTT